MTLKLLPSHAQLSLFDLMPDKPLTTPGESRTRYGRVVEEIAEALLDLHDIPNSGSHEIVYDAFGHGHFCEIKSIRHGSKLPLYEWRMEKDKKCGAPLVYVIVIHRCTKAGTLGEVWQKMADTIKDILVLPVSVMHRLAEAEPLQRILSESKGPQRVGYSRKGYCDGYHNVPLSKMRAEDFHSPVSRSCSVYELPVSANIHFHASLTPWF